MKFLDDCLLYRGDKPCAHNRLCEGCPHYAPPAGRLLIIKIGAAGDVLRTTTLLPGLAEKYRGFHVTWLTAHAASPLVEGHPLVHRIMHYGAETYTSLAPCEFDVIICLDKEPGPAGLATLLNARIKLGVGLGKNGMPVPLNAEAWDYFALGLSDELKFKRNTRDYHQLVAEALDVPYDGAPPVMNISEADLADGMDVLKSAGWDGTRPVVGINTGSGTAFANKMLSTVAIVDLIDLIAGKVPDAFIVLLGGPSEWEKNQDIARASGGRAVDTGCNHPVKRFAGIVSHCSAVVCGDTLAMHIAIARGRKVVALFGPTCEQEISLFGHGVKVVSGMDCVPCYRRECTMSPNCMNSLDLCEIAAHVASLLARTSDNYN